MLALICDCDKGQSDCRAIPGHIGERRGVNRVVIIEEQATRYAVDAPEPKARCF
jgi:hypothetical protein